jgi:hypothetical protein
VKERKIDVLAMGVPGPSRWDVTVSTASDQALRAIDLAIHAVKHVLLAIRRALHEAVAPAGARIALARHQLKPARAPPVAQMLRLGPHREHKARWRIDEPSQDDRRLARRHLDLKAPAGHDPSWHLEILQVLISSPSSSIHFINMLLDKGPRQSRDHPQSSCARLALPTDTRGLIDLPLRPASRIDSQSRSPLSEWGSTAQRPRMRRAA